MTSIVIGMGEIGTALYNVLHDKYKDDVQSYDITEGDKTFEQDSFDLMHICIPYGNNFVNVVKSYEQDFKPKFVIIHSTVPVGTTKSLGGNYLNSPVRGKHPEMEQGLKTYVKYLSYNEYETYEKIQDIVDYFVEADIRIKITNNTDSTELGKLLALCRYGVYIAFAKEQEKICELFNVEYTKTVADWDKTRNDGLITISDNHLLHPILYPFKDYVGGHCTVEDMEIMLSQVNSPLLSTAYNIDRNTQIWGNCNIYKTARIGKGCSIGAGTEIGDKVVIGNNVRIGAQCFIPEGVTIEDDVFIAPKVTFSNDKYPPSDRKCWEPITIKKGAVIGMGAIILPGVTVEENALIGAGSVVTKNVPANEKWYGNPAYSHGTKEGV